MPGTVSHSQWEWRLLEEVLKTKPKSPGSFHHCFDLTASEAGYKRYVKAMEATHFSLDLDEVVVG